MGLSKITKRIIRDLQDDFEQMLQMDSDIEVIWKLENLHNNKALIKSAEFIRKSFNKS